MTVEDQIRYLQSKIASLEARLESSQSQADNPTTEGRLLGTTQPTVDPKGRKIWEAEWRGDYQVMMAYVPDNALIIDGENVEVEADDKEGDEVTLSDGSWYLHAYKNKTTGNWEAELDQEPTGTREDEEAKYNIHICDIHEDGYIEKQYVVGSIVIGGAGSKFVGDDEEGASEEINSSDGVIHLQGFKGGADGERTGNSGLEFLTVGAREGEDGEKIPPKAIIDVKGRATASGCGNTENWGCHSLKKDGNLLGHFLGCRDIDIIKEGGGGGGSASDVIGSDYIDVDDETDAQGQKTGKRKVSAKINTPANQNVKGTPNALLTHDENQFVRCVKTFLGFGQDAAQKKVVIDGPNGKVEVRNAAGNRIIKLDAADIPNECGQGGAATIQVRKLTVTHPRTKDGKTSETYHILGCRDIDINEGDAIDTITSGTPTQSGGFTLTPVTIKLKDGTSLPAFNISAKNGADGDPGSDGDDAGLKVTATTHQPTQADPRTGTDIVLTPTVNGVDQTPTTFTIYDGNQGVGIGSVEEDPSQSSGRTRTYKVMSDEATPRLLGTLTVTDGRSIGSVVLKSTSGKTRTYSVMSGDTPASELGTFSVTDGADGEDGTPAGFGAPTATATELSPGSTPTVSVSASGSDTAKVFAFQFGIPKGKNVKSDWNATSGDSEILNKPTSLKNPHALTIKKSGSADVVYDGSAAKTITLDPGGVTKIIGSGAVHVSPSSGTGEVTVSSTVRNLVAGSGIGITASGNDITITNTAQGGGGTTEGFTGTAPWLDGFKYDKTTHKLMYRFGSIRFENGLAVEYTPGGDDDFVDVPGGDAVKETV